MKNLPVFMLLFNLACSSAPIAVIDGGPDVNDAGNPDGGTTDGGSSSCVESCDCCDGACVDLATRAHCGACNVHTGDQEICLDQSIVLGRYSSICAFEHLALITNQSDGDNAQARSLAASFQSTCGEPFSLEEIADTNIRFVNPDSHLVDLSPDIVVLGVGGPGSNIAVKGAEERSIGLRLFFSGPSTVEYVNTDTGLTVFSMDPNTVSATHDYLLIQSNVLLSTNQLVLSAYGYDSPGTQAALRYVAQALPAEHTLVIEWNAATDTSEETFVIKVSQ